MKTLSQHNYKFFLVEGTIFFIALAFITQDGLIPVFIHNYTGSLVLVGTATSIRSFFTTMPKILVANKLNQVENMPRFTAFIMIFTRPLVLFMIPILLLIREPKVIVGLFLMITALLWSGHSIVTITWNDVFARTVEGPLRGKVHGYQQFFGGIAGLGVGYLVKRLLDHPTLTQEQSYMIIFGLCGIFMLASSLLLLKVKDKPREKGNHQRSLAVYLKRLPGYLKTHHDFRKVTIASMFQKLIVLANPFTILVAKNVLNSPSEVITTLIYIQIVGGLAGGYVWGNISQKLGNKWVITLSNASIALSATLVVVSILLSSGPFALGLIMVSVFLSGFNTTSWLGYLNYTLDVAGEGERIDLLIMQSIIMLPFAFGGYLVGLAVNQYGYMLLYLLTILIAMLAFKWSMGLNRINNTHFNE